MHQVKDKLKLGLFVKQIINPHTRYVGLHDRFVRIQKFKPNVHMRHNLLTEVIGYKIFHEARCIQSGPKVRALAYCLF